MSTNNFDFKNNPKNFIRSLIPQEKRVIKTIAKAICSLRNIAPLDQNLVAIIGRGSEHTNQEAVITWIEGEFFKGVIELDQEALSHLLQRFRADEFYWESAL